MKDKHYTIFFSLAALVVMLDQLTKILLREYLPDGGELLGYGFLSIIRTENTGAAFSMLQDYQGLLIWITVIFIGLVLYYYDTFPKKKSFNIFLGLVFGGAIGNLIDRILFGTVTDFINLSIWPTFNIADSCITIGVIGLILFWGKEEK